MKHRLKKGRKLNRNKGQRKALLRGLTKNLVDSGSIETTLEKAKELKRHMDSVMKFAKSGDLPGRRRLISELGSADYASKLIEEAVLRFEDRVSGFTTIKRTVKRDGDNAQLAVIKWVETTKKEPAAKTAGKEGKKETSRVKREAKPSGKTDTKVKKAKDSSKENERN